MPHVEDQIAEWMAAYRVLGVPLSASAISIKENYRRLMKRWHPDLFANGSEKQLEANRMTSLFNRAYEKIENAPLRHYLSNRSQVPAIGPAAARPMGRRPFLDPPDPFRNMERVEFWVKFGIGAVFGALFGAGSLLDLYRYDDPGTWGALAILLGTMVIFGIGSVKGGDKFWDAVFRRSWWQWP
jgi:DnaJ-class molecular chaperone